tara:strand:+ start:601 stop:804 length:204 start_codon:yes stop_codon:yes gene_type:complete
MKIKKLGTCGYRILDRDGGVILLENAFLSMSFSTHRISPKNKIFDGNFFETKIEAQEDFYRRISNEQ